MARDAASPSWVRSERLSDRTGEQLVALYRSGKTVHEISVLVGVHRTTVLRHLHQRGVDTGYRKLRPEDVADCVVRYESGETCRQIAEDFGVHPDTVRRRLVASGVVMRVGRFGG